LQLNDALFPIGAYTQSGGLETYIQKGLVCSFETASSFLRNRLRFAVLYGELLPARLAWDYTDSADFEKLSGLNALLDAAKLPSEGRTAGQKMGSRFIKTVSGFCDRADPALFGGYLEAVGTGKHHHCVAYGMLCRACGIDLREALSAFLYAQASLITTNCVKAVPLSQTDGQKLLNGCMPVYSRVLDAVFELDEEDVCLSTPGFDIRAMQHEGLYSRIYMS